MISFLKEIEMGQGAKANAIKVSNEKGGEVQPSPKKSMTDQGEKRDTSNLQIELFSSKGCDESGQGSKQAGFDKDIGSKEDDNSAPLVTSLSPIDELTEMDGQNFRHSFKKNEVKEDSLSNREDRVQGLSGNHLTSSEDDVGLEEGQASQTDKQSDQGIHISASEMMDSAENLGKDQVISVDENTSEKYAKKGSEVDEGSMGNSESDQASEGAVINVTEAQKILDTRYSSRLQSKMEEKINNQEKQSKKRSLAGTNLSSCNSFAVLDDNCIAGIAKGMGVLIPTDTFDTIDILKDIEIARHTVDKKNDSSSSGNGK
jgi:hypothetical protein